MTAHLVTGPPRCGKTTVLERTADRLAAAGHSVGGVVCPEIRREGTRVGFAVRDRSSGHQARMASVAFEGPPRVGRYGVDTDAIDAVAGPALERARREADCVMIDELAPMQLESDRFVAEATACIESETPVLASITETYRDGIAGTVRDRDDVACTRVTPETRERLPAELCSWVRRRIR